MRPTQRQSQRAGAYGTHHADGLRQVIDARELFWNNVIRDILMSISVMKIQQTEAIRAAMEQAKAQATVQSQTATDGGGTTITGPYVGKKGATPKAGFGAAGVSAGQDAETDGSDEEEDVEGEGEGGVLGPIELVGMPPFDGRLAVVTVQGVRIAIADVFPLFACSIEGSDVARELSADVQCTVFQIRTPQGEVFTLPVHEIRSFHSLSEELMAQIEAASARTNAAGTKTTVPFGFGAFTSLARSAETEGQREGGEEKSPAGKGG